MNFIGEPYAGKLHVRFDEGAEKGFSLLALLYCPQSNPWLNSRSLNSVYVNYIYDILKASNTSKIT
jgi:hypothetical protein